MMRSHPPAAPPRTTSLVNGIETALLRSDRSSQCQLFQHPLRRRNQRSMSEPHQDGGRHRFTGLLINREGTLFIPNNAEH